MIKNFLVRADDSNIGMCAILLQLNNKDEKVLMQRASKKFTPAGD